MTSGPFRFAVSPPAALVHREDRVDLEGIGRPQIEQFRVGAAEGQGVGLVEEVAGVRNGKGKILIGRRDQPAERQVVIQG